MSQYGSYGNSKRNKSTMVRKANNKINQRGFDEAEINTQRFSSRMDVDRIMLERQMTSPNFANDDDKFVGELTGEEVNSSDVFDKGMPVRSSFTVKRSLYDNNSHLDFDLYQKIDKRKLDNVDYSDMNGGDYAILDEAMKPITKGSDPYETCVSDISTTTCWMHSNMFTISKEDYIVNGLGLFSAFGVIYLIGKGNTEIELKNYFGYQDKRHLNAGLLTIREDLNKYRDQIVIDNYIINDKTIPSRGDAAKRLKSLIFNIIINRDYPDQEAERVNGIIKTISKLENVISSNTVSMSDISLISVSKLNPIWAYKIDNIVKSRVHKDTGVEIVSFIRFMGKTFDYYEDAERQIVEVPLHGDILVIGLIINKRGLQEPTELKVLTTAFNYMKPTVLDEVMIPIIRKRYKTRLNKTLQKTGLNVTFSENEMVGLYPEGGTINDCLQYVDLDFGTRCGNKQCNNKGYRTTRKFVCNSTFEFYLRSTETSCIMMFGRL
jgi:serine protease inhibitor